MKRPLVPLAVLLVLLASLSTIAMVALWPGQVARRVSMALLAFTRAPSGAEAVRVDRMGNLVLEGFWFGPDDGVEVRAERVVLHRRPLAALLGRLVVRRVEAAGVRIVLPADGVLPGAPVAWFQRHAGVWRSSTVSVSDLDLSLDVGAGRAPETWRVTGLEGRPDLAGRVSFEAAVEGPQGSHGRVDGTWAPATGGVRGRLRIDRQPAAGPAVQRVSATLAGVCSAFRPEGPIDLVLDFEARPGEAVRRTWSAEAFDLTLHPPGLGMPVERVSGRVHPGGPGEVIFEDVAGRVAGGEVRLVGRGGGRIGSGGWRLTLRAGPLGLAAFEPVLDPGWLGVWRLLRPRGAVALDLGLAGKPAGGDAVGATLRAAGEVRLDGLAVAPGPWLWRVDGALRIVKAEARDGGLEGEVSTKRLLVGSLALGEVSARFRLDGQGLVIDGLEATVLGGRVRGRIAIAAAGPATEARLAVDLECEGLDSHGLSPPFAPHAQEGTGRLDGLVSLAWWGDGGGPVSGTFEARFDGAAWDPPLYRAALGEISRRTPGDQVLRAGRIRGRVVEGTVQVEAMHLAAAQLALSGEGRWTDADGLDLTLYGITGGRVADCYASPAAGIEDLGADLVRLRVTGTPRAPDVVVGAPGGRLAARFGGFFPKDERDLFLPSALVGGKEEER